MRVLVALRPPLFFAIAVKVLSPLARVWFVLAKVRSARRGLARERGDVEGRRDRRVEREGGVLQQELRSGREPHEREQGLSRRDLLELGAEAVRADAVALDRGQPLLDRGRRAGRAQPPEEVE